jgi:uncharacterized protein YuzE
VPDQAEASAREVSEDGAMDVSWDRSVDAAYISLIPPDEQTYGVAADSISLEELGQDGGIGTLHSLVLDFDRDGKLIGIEVLNARASLRESTLRAAQ